MKKSLLPAFAVLAAIALNTTDLQADAPLRSTGEPVTTFVRGPGASMITPATPLSTLLWDSRFGLPALAPDGHQLTLGEWTAVEPRAHVQCINDGTLVVLHVSGLVPKGVYSVSVLVFNGPFPAGPGPVGPFPFGNIVGMGSLGAMDGSENTFQASASGEGQLTVRMAPGPISLTPPPPFLANRPPYVVEGCLLDEVEFHLSAVYHFDSMTYGPSPGFQHGASEQFRVIFRP